MGEARASAFPTLRDRKVHLARTPYPFVGRFAEAEKILESYEIYYRRKSRNGAVLYRCR